MVGARITPVLLCGGSGKRLWPKSRDLRPKPFIPLVGDSTLFEAAISRCDRGDGFDAPMVVTGASHVDHVEEQLAGLEAKVIVEPLARNTAAAIALAALELPGDAVMLVCPSDHHIADVPAFATAARKAAALASGGWLVSFGIEAKGPETGYGYLEVGEAIGDEGFRTARFVEKPSREKAEQFLAAGGYAWNGGIFAFRADRFLEELERHRPNIVRLARESLATAGRAGQRVHPDRSAFEKIESESVDYAVMENTDRAALVPVDMGWSDIGSWASLQDSLASDPSGNSTRGAVELVDCKRVLVDSDGPRVSVIGLEDVVIVVDGNEILVTTRDGAQHVGKLEGALNQ